MKEEGEKKANQKSISIPTSPCELDLISKKVHVCKQNVTQGKNDSLVMFLMQSGIGFFTCHDLFGDPFVCEDMKLFAKSTSTAEITVYILFLSVLVSLDEIHEPLRRGSE